MNNEEKLKQENNFLKEMIRTYYMPEIDRLNNIINKAIEYIEEKCVDDEFYINLSNKEKQIIEVLKILKGETNEKSNI